MMRMHENGEHGFTLVEMLVALSIFALISAAGVGLLRSSVDTQTAVERKLSDLAAAARLRALLANDLVQAVDRPTRAAGAEAPAFVGQPSEMRFVRAGWIDPGGSVRPELQGVRWSVSGGTLTRTARAALDGGSDGPAAAVARNLTVATFRYRGLDGAWRESWAPLPTEPPLPAAVELTITGADERPVTLIIALPPIPAPLPAAGTAPEPTA